MVMTGTDRTPTAAELVHWKAVFERLPRLTLEVFLLGWVDGYSEARIAQRLGLYRWQVRRHMVRAIAMINRHTP